MNTFIRNVTPADLDRCYAIETVAYEGDEAATRKRQQAGPRQACSFAGRTRRINGMAAHRAASRSA